MAILLSVALPFLLPWGFVLSPFVLLAHFRGARFRRAFLGYQGEVQVGRILRRLPREFYVLSDVDLGGENADFVVVSPSGVYSVEVKNYALPVQARPDGLYVAGRSKGEILQQARRQAEKLERLFGVRATPVLVFLGEVRGKGAGGVVVLSARELAPFLLKGKKHLPKREVQRILRLLGRRVR